MKSGISALIISLISLNISHATDFVVSTNSDSGPGSLRQAILDANAGGGGAISFSNVSGSIYLLSALPQLTGNISIYGPGASQLVISNSIFNNAANNTAALSGLTIIGDGVDNYGTFALLDSIFGPHFSGRAPVRNWGTMTISRCTFTGNRDFESSDSIENNGTMSVYNCAITNNQGGGDVVNSGTLTMDNSVVSGHRFFTSSWGGVINVGGFLVLRNCSITNNDSVEGGGIWNGGSLAVTNCLISYNIAAYSEPSMVGGGLYNIGYAVLQNTTISGNYAQAAGAGIWNGGSLRLLNCTVTSNTVTYNPTRTNGLGGGVFTGDRTVFEGKNSIIAGNNSYSPNQTLPDDIGGSLWTLGHNIILGTNGWPQASYDRDDLLGVDPMLGPLQDNGGPTWTHALLQGSPAIDAGVPTGAPADDQRGVSRPQGLGVDIGAFEFQFPAIPIFAPVQIQSKTNLFLKAFGFPSTSYTLQASQDFISWDNIATLTAPSNGVLQFTELINPIACPKRFFRLRSQSP
jgi:hypothetical protein